nr:hypothetical protein GCM10020092_100010 [Actinoplanes digitatis]
MHLEFTNIGYAHTLYYLGLDKLPGAPGGDGFVGNQLIRMNLQGGRWRATNDGVFDSIIYPLAKAIADRPRFNFVEEGREAEIEVPVFFLLLSDSDHGRTDLCCLRQGRRYSCQGS